MKKKAILISATLLLVSCGSSNSTTLPSSNNNNWTKTVNEGEYGIETLKYSSTTINNNDNMILNKLAIGIYSKGTGDVINNTGDMTLGESAIGIYSIGKNIVNNSGTIIVGETDVKGRHDKVEKHLNSIGIYVAEGVIAKNTGTITVKEEHSIGVYVTGEETTFTNNGTIEVDNGGVGIIVRDGAVAINKGDITLGSTLATCGATTVGMSAAGAGKYGIKKSTIINDGTITVNQGVGMLVGKDAKFENNGTIVVNNGVGIQGIGYFVNAGDIKVNGGKATSSSSGDSGVGSVVIDPKGDIKINSNYRSLGGTLSTDGNIIVDGAYADVTTGAPLFNANNVSGEINILPNFVLTGNGNSYKIENFVNTTSGTITELTALTSPLFTANVTNEGDLVIVKRTYAETRIGKKFDELDKALDNISRGEGKDKEILRNLDFYLGEVYRNSPDQFEREAALKLGETRGDIYSTIQRRMQDINNVFDNSFEELQSSYNLTKDSNKFSLLYTDGNFENSTVGIDDYDYKVMGLLYMKEKEGADYGSKYGYTLGFAGSKFDFDDGGSKEDVYSLRVGAHREKNLSTENKVSWLSRVELGYNRHIAKRKLNLQETFENEGEYNTYSVSLDNRVTKTIYTDLSRELSVYGDLELEYGRVDSFRESAGSKGGLEVEIKDNDYLSTQAGLGVKGSQRIYTGNKGSLKLFADMKYAYELGENYDGNKARLKNGGEGYYSLITPEKRDGIFVGKIGLTLEKENHMGLTFEVEMADEGNSADNSIKYGVRANYKF